MNTTKYDIPHGGINVKRCDSQEHAGPGCRCKDPRHPQKHGPYYQLSFTWRGKSSSRFVRREQVAEMRRKLARYKRFRKLVNEWVDLEVERAEREKEKRTGGD
jgi:hypothetical protein